MPASPGGVRKQPTARKSRTKGDTPGAPQTFGAIKLADLLTPRLIGRFRYCGQLGWLQFNGAKWDAEDAESKVLGEVVTTVKEYTQSLLNAGSGLSRDQCMELAGFSGAQAQSQAIKISRGREGVLTAVKDFDAQPDHGKPWLVCCENGWTIELWPNGDRRPRRTLPTDMNTRVACPYDPEASAVKTGKAFKQYQPDDNVRRYLLQQWCRGMSGQGTADFIVNHGETAGNGKSTMQTLLTAVAGDYAMTLPVELILKSGGRSARVEFRAELAAMKAARLVFTAEPEEGARFALNTIKDMTGGAEFTGRAHYKDQVTFVPRILLQLATNHRPQWAADEGMARRYVEIAWNYQIPRGVMRENFKEELKAESSGFLNRILENWVGESPLERPEVIEKQTEKGARESSPASRFVVEALEVAEGGSVSARAMYDAFVEWCKQNGVRAISSNRLGRELTRLGYEKEKLGTVRYSDLKIAEEYIPTRTF